MTLEAERIDPQGVLDLPSGDGQFSRKLDAAGPNVTGADPFPEERAGVRSEPLDASVAILGPWAGYGCPARSRR